MAMSHLQSLVASTHVRNTDTASPTSAHHYHLLPNVIIAGRMFSSRRGRRQPSLSSIASSSAASSSKLTSASSSLSLDSTDSTTSKSRRIVRRKLCMGSSDVNATSLANIQVDVVTDGSDIETSAAADSDDDVTLVGADHVNLGTLWPKAMETATITMKDSEDEQKSQDAEHQPQHTFDLEKKILEHISDSEYTSYTPDQHYDELEIQMGAIDHHETSTPGCAPAATTRALVGLWGPWDMLCDPNDYDVEFEERTIVCHTQLSPSPCHRLRRLKDPFVF